MSINGNDLISSYLSWLRQKMGVVAIGDTLEITTPFLDRHNDHIQVFVTPTESGLRLTDDGYILSDLRSSGCEVDTPNRKKILESILNGFGVSEVAGELALETSREKFPQKKHALLQAMLAVNDMFMTSRHRVATLFLEDVATFLDQNEIRYSPNVEFTGKSGFIHKFDFLIPKSPKRPERLVRAINHPSKDSVTSLLFNWTDIKDVRSQNSRFYVVLNDAEKKVSPDLIKAFEEYDINVIEWTKRQKSLSELAA
ncbi:MAG: DUF1829 domain-containing protein [Planctomycetota bacterium]|nr:DUF1829 domain-containing protein [Planctomycetota bacterium]MDA1211396.1 DUF1829 domain-containing protein [Planctomycetota bacterium]